MSEVAVTETQHRLPVRLDATLPLDEAYRLSQALAMANSLPQALRGKPSDVLAIILYGQELGLRPMQAIQGIYVVNGRPTLAAQTWLALIRRAGHHAEVREHTDATCTVVMRRGDDGSEHVETFTWADAERAKLVGKDVWKQYPRRMLLARAVSDCARFLCPEVALGFYGEGDDFTDDVEPVAVQVERPVDAEPLDAETALAEVEAIEAELVGEVPGQEPLL